MKAKASAGEDAAVAQQRIKLGEENQKEKRGSR